MFILLLVVFSVAIALLRGGRLTHLLDIEVRYRWMLFIPFVLQLIAFTNFGDTPVLGATLAQFLYLGSMGVAVIAVWFNRHLPGVLLVGVGLLLNLVVIALNGGYMPVSMQARQVAGMPELTGRDMNVVPMTPATALPFLGDILPIPAWLPFANVFSIGDVCIALGAVVFVQRTLVPTRVAKRDLSQT